MVWVVLSENWSVADSVCTPVTVPRWNPRSWGVRFNLLPNLLYCGAGLVARNRTWTFSFGRKREGGLGWVGLDSPDLKNATDPSR